MRLLDAFLALALTMAVFASAATALVGMFHRFTNRRSTDLRKMFATIFDKSLAGVLQKAGANTDDLRAEFVKILSTDTTLSQLATDDKGRVRPAAEKIVAARGVTIDDAMRRLSRGAPLLASVAKDKLTPTQLEEALKDVVRAYASAEQAATEMFARHAHRLSYVFGLFLAITVNVDAVHMLNFYLVNPDSARQTIAHLETLEKSVTPAATQNGAAAPNQPPAAGGSVPTTALTDDIRGVIDDLKGLGMVGVPVGWGFFPYCKTTDGSVIDMRCKPATAKGAAPISGWNYALWAFCVAITGLLIGLGGPYWFDIATSISSVRDFIKGGGKAQAAAKPPATPEELDERIKAIVAKSHPATPPKPGDGV